MIKALVKPLNSQTPVALELSHRGVFWLSRLTVKSYLGVFIDSPGSWLPGKL